MFYPELKQRQLKINEKEQQYVWKKPWERVNIFVKQFGINEVPTYLYWEREGEGWRENQCVY